MGQSNTNAIVQRKMLEQHRIWGKKAGIKPEDIRPQTLYLYGKLTANNDTIYFDPSDKSASVAATEVRLKESSLFFANLFGLALHKAKIAASVEYPAGSPLHTYPDKNVFGGAAGTAALTEAESLEMVYHSLLSLKTDQTLRVDNMSTKQFRMVPFTQNGATSHPSTEEILRDLSTSFFMWGDRGNEFSLRLPQKGGDRTNIFGTATGQNYVVLAIGGFEVVNAANNSRVIDYMKMVDSQ